MRALAGLLMVLATLVAQPAAAHVTLVNERGFVLRFVATVPVAPAKAWEELLQPADWWDSDHSFSGDAKNFTLEAKPGGCFCETLPGAGGVEHMRVVYVEKPRALRMIGALGPMQADALTGTLTVQLKAADGGGTEIMWEYVVGGFARTPFDAISTSVDKVMGEQLNRLAGKLGGKVDEVEVISKPSDGPKAPEDGPSRPAIIGR